MRKNKINILSLLFLLLFGYGLCSCSKGYLEPTVTQSKDLATNINKPEDLDGLLLGAYERMSQSGYYGRDIIVHGSIRSDDGYSTGNSGRFVSSAQFNYQSTDGDPSRMWNAMYQTIANANIVINSQIEEDGTDEVKHIKGEAYAIRALAHMDLLRMFGQQWTGGTLGIPYVTEYLGDLAPSRNTVQEVWDLIGEDLDMASGLMSESLNNGPTRFTTYGVAALKTRYYLYTQNWSSLIDAAEYIINSGNFDLATSATLASSYVGDGGNESIFELDFTIADNPSINGLNQIYANTGYGDAVCTADLYNIYEAGDTRRSLITWDADNEVYRMTGKYPSETWDDNVRVIRYAEVLLNYAEALFNTGNTAESLIALNRVPSAVGGSLYTTASMDNIILERRKELAFEGFRFFDLMRNGLDINKVDAGQTFSGTKVSPGESRVAFPIPESEINANSNMIQNTGY